MSSIYVFGLTMLFLERVLIWWGWGLGCSIAAASSKDGAVGSKFMVGRDAVVGTSWEEDTDGDEGEESTSREWGDDSGRVQGDDVVMFSELEETEALFWESEDVLFGN